jgi:hypothetical protein
MAAQVIRCPAHMLASIPTGEFRESPDDPGISIEAQEAAICVVSLDPQLAWDCWPPFGHRTFALMLVGDAEADVDDRPHRLPDDLVVPVIEALARHAMPHLTGHEAVELVAILDTAKQASNDLPRPCATRLPHSRFERKLCEAALRLEHTWSNMLDDLDQQIAGYGDALRRCGLGPIIADLSSEAVIADLLHLTPDGSPHRYRQVHDSPAWHLAVAEIMRKSRAARQATWWTLMDLKSCGTYQNEEVSPAIFEELYRFGCVFPVPDWGQSLWRRDDAIGSVCSAFVPSRGIATAMQYLAAACDRSLLGHRNPIITAALLAYTFMRIRPFGSSDRRASELLFNLLLRQIDVPPMPLQLTMHRKRLDMTAALESSIASRQPDTFVEAAIRLMTHSLAAGKTMIGPLWDEYRRLTNALTEARFDRADSDTAGSVLLSNLLVPWITDEGYPRASDCIEAQARHLHARGLIDVIHAGRRSWWSSPIARRFVSV